MDKSDQQALVEDIVKMCLGESLPETECNYLVKMIPDLLPNPFGISENISLAISTTNLKTASLFYDRIWSCVPGHRNTDWAFFGGTEYEVINAIFLFLKDGVTKVHSSHPEQRNMLLRLHWLHELYLATGEFHEVDMSKTVALDTPISRSIAKSISTELGVRVATMYNSQAEYSREYQAGDTEVIISCFSDLMIIDEEALSWEQVREFRKDRDAKLKCRRLVHWFDKNMIGKPKAYMENEISARLEDYQWAIKKHGIKSVLGTMSSVLESKSALAGLSSAMIFSWLDQSALGLMSGLGILGAKCSLELAKISLEREEIRRSSPEISFVHELKRKFGRA
jgi:hypothetical protein